MNTKSVCAALIAVAMIVAPAAQAQEAAANPDQQCLAVSLMAAGQKKKDVQQFGVMASYYFLGHLQGRSTDSITRQALADYLRNVTDEEFASAMDRCVGEFERAANVFGQLADGGAADKQN